MASTEIATPAKTSTATALPPSQSITPVLLLKTKSLPTDPYDVLFTSTGEYEPVFIPVFQHTHINLDILKGYILGGKIEGVGATKKNDGGGGGGGTSEESEERSFGGLIVTSQRAVEAVGSLLVGLKESHPEITASFLSSTLIYVVGPATRKALIGLGFSPANIFGEESGNGATLADYIIDHYTHPARDLLFLVGETHGTVIPHRLAEQEPPIRVEELVVYQTETKTGFESMFRDCLDAMDDVSLKQHSVPPEGGKEGKKEGGEEIRWIIVFSPTGLDAALRVMAEREKMEVSNVRYKICTIGPTTQDYMWQGFKKKPDAMARSPTPEGLLEGMRAGMRAGFDLNI